MLDQDLIIDNNQVSSLNTSLVLNTTTHELKTINPCFNLMWNDNKDFEYRLYDRDYKPFDNLILKEYDQIKNSYLSRKIHCTIGLIMINTERYDHEMKHRIDSDPTIEINSALIIPFSSIPFDYCIMNVFHVSRFIFIDNQWKEVE